MVSPHKLNKDNSPLVSVNDLSLTLGGHGTKVEILKQLNFVADAGKTVAVTGASGSGKTSFLMLLAGLERPSAGQITIAGQSLPDLDEDGLASFRQSHIGIVFQSFHLIPSLSALHNVSLAIELGGTPAKAAESKAKTALEEMGLGARIHHLPGQLSGGEQQRVAIARAFAANPRLILADEPTGNLDEETGQNVMRLLFDKTAKAGSCLILITHDKQLAARCDEGWQMRQGQLSRLD